MHRRHMAPFYAVFNSSQSNLCCFFNLALEISFPVLTFWTFLVF